MKIITVSREFGSGGREIGKRLADELGFAYYDREIVSAIAEKTSLDEGYIERTLDSSILNQVYPVTFSRTFAFSYHNIANATNLLAKQHQVVRELAQKGDCVIVGRSADALLSDLNPFKLFIYADMQSKIDRCKKRADESENFTDKEYKKKIEKIDKARAENHDFVSSYAWGDMKNYDLCINTTNIDIKAIVPKLAEYIKTTY